MMYVLSNNNVIDTVCVCVCACVCVCDDVLGGARVLINQWKSLAYQIPCHNW